MSFSEEMARLDDEWRQHRRRIDAVVCDPAFTNGAFLSGYKIAHYHARPRDPDSFQAAYAKSMQEMTHLHHQVCLHAQELAALHLHRDHSDPATWQAYPGDTAPFIRDLEHLIHQLRVHADALRPHVPKKHHADMDEPFATFSDLAVPLLDALKEASAIARRVQELQTPRPNGIKSGNKQTEIDVIPEKWRECDISDLCQLQRGFDLTEATRKQGDVPVYSSSGLSYFHNEARLQPPSVITGRKGMLGRVFFVEEPCWPHDTTLWVKDFKGNHPRFVALFLGQFRLERFDAATSVPTLNRNNVVGIPIKLPPLPEQRAIAAALSDVDGLLGGLDRLIAKKRDLKQAAMQQLLTGQTRLPGFHGGWAKVELGKLIKEIGDGATPSTADSRNFGGGIHWVVIDDIKDEITTTVATLTERGLHSCAATLWQPGTLILSTGATIGEVGIARIPVATKQGICGIVFDQSQAIAPFMKYWFVQNKPKLLGKAQGSTIKEVRAPTLIKIELSVPPVPEQTAIATVLSEMDEELGKLEERREKTRALKQAMMQELLTGRTRLV